MNKKYIVTEKAAKAIGPYSQGVSIGDFVFTSGQLPINPYTNTMPESIEEQTKQSLDNIKEILKAEGLTLDNVVKVTVFLSDMNNFSSMNSIYSEYFQNSKPARSAVEVARLPKDALIEIEAIAVKS